MENGHELLFQRTKRSFTSPTSTRTIRYNNPSNI